MSNRNVPREKFENNGGAYIAYSWVDHHSPSLRLLFESCEDMFLFLTEKMTKERVITVNCNAGKGRTGTSIACFLIYSGLADNYKQAVNYYGNKRFKNGRGVT
jgi:protein-tyrosine phosphatase